ncbi:MAG TPA: hypothetical protein VF347_02805, partial [Candidatus Humimicrobiaceae bacterium]
MNKIISGKLEKTIISIVISLILAVAVLVFTSCRSDYQKALNGETGIVTGESVAKTTAGTDTNTTGQPAASGKETASTSGSETGTAGTTETTAQATNPAAQQVIEVIASGGYSPRK